MTFICKGICSRYKAKKPNNHASRYASGQKHCEQCGFIKWEGIWCPCCNQRLRTKPRKMSNKQLLTESVQQAVAI